jgi:hypothetical protein
MRGFLKEWVHIFPKCLLYNFSCNIYLDAQLLDVKSLLQYKSHYRKTEI